MAPAYSGSKAVLEAQLNKDPHLVLFDDPSPFGTREFRGSEIPKNSNLVVVMDPLQRRRFAKVCRGRDDKFKVL